MTTLDPKTTSLDSVKAEAKQLLKSTRAEDADALSRVRPYFEAAGPNSKLSEVQLVVAREYGFDSWTKLKRHLELRADFEDAGSRVVQLRQNLAQTLPDLPSDHTATTLHCSFCDKPQYEVGKLVAGPSVFICDECIGLCNDIIEDASASGGS